MNRLRIAHVTTVDLSLRGLLLNQLASLREAGYDVAGISAAGRNVPAIEAAGIRHLAVPMSRNLTPFADLASLWRLYRVMRRERFTIVHTHTPKAGLLGQLAARLAGVPVVMNTIHGFYFHEYMRPAARRFYITMEKVAALCSDRILSQNAEDIRTGIAEGIFPAQKIDHLGNGIDLSTFDPDRVEVEEVDAWRARLRIPPSAKVVGFVGRLAARRKGFRDFLAAGREVLAHRSDVRFVIVGEADHGKPDAVEPSAAGEYGIAKACVFLGRIANSELPALYRMMDVLVLPSLFEGVPRVIMEAAAMGVPAVATDVKGNREAVADGRTGVLAPLGDVDALARAIVGILGDEAKGRAMGEAARAMAREQFDEQTVFAKVKAEYSRLLIEKGLAAPCGSEARGTMRSGHDAGMAAVRALNAGGIQETVNYVGTHVRDRSSKKEPPMQRGKRLFDLALAVAALVILAPVIAIVAVLVRIAFGAPVLFCQRRPGLHGRPFTIYKFRTMTDARDASGQLLTDAERLTRFGRFLRSSSLDELPELWNVLKGEMSIVGPRPLLIEYLPLYSPEQARRHDVRPGITGWAQVNGRNAMSWPRKFALDIWYVDHHSLWLDLKIIGLTLWTVLKRDGINQPGHATGVPFGGEQLEAHS